MVRNSPPPPRDFRPGNERAASLLFLFSSLLSLSIIDFPPCAFYSLCSFPEFMALAVRSRRTESRAGCRFRPRFLGRSFYSFDARPPQPSIKYYPLLKGPRCSRCSRSASCLPSEKPRPPQPRPCKLGWPSKGYCSALFRRNGSKRYCFSSEY